MVKITVCTFWATLLLFLAGCTLQPAEPENPVDLNREEYRTWKTRGGSYASIRYTSLDEINRENVADLEVVWSYSTGDLEAGDRTEIQNDPVKIGSTHYEDSPKLKIRSEEHTSELQSRGQLV